MGFFKWLITLPQTYSTKSRPRSDALSATLSATLSLSKCLPKWTGLSTQIFDNWIQVLQSDNKAFMKAASLAQRATKYLLENAGIVEQTEEETA